MNINRDRGNILFLILLAVVLFAALSYAVTSSLRGGGQDASQEKAKAEAAEIMQYVGGLRGTITRMALQYGVENLLFDCLQTTVLNCVSPIASWADVPTSAYKYEVFHPQGGNFQARSFKFSTSLYPLITMNTQINGIGTTLLPQPSTSNLDLVYYLPEIPRKTCEEINRQLGLAIIPITGFDFAVTGRNYNTEILYDGYTLGDANNVALAPEVKGMDMACINGDPTSEGGYIFYAVLYAR